MKRASSVFWKLPYRLKTGHFGSLWVPWAPLEGCFPELQRHLKGGPDLLAVSPVRIKGKGLFKGLLMRLGKGKGKGSGKGGKAKGKRKKGTLLSESPLFGLALSCVC